MFNAMLYFFKSGISFARQLFHRPQFIRSSNALDEYWRSKRGENIGILNEFQSKRLEFLRSNMALGSRVVDLGCGDGAILGELGAENYKLFGADLSDLALARVEKMGVNPVRFDLESGDIQSLPSCDYILLLEVLEHLSRPEEVLLACVEKAEKGVIFSVPNTGHISHRLRLLFGRFPLQWRVHPGEHLRFWTLADLRWWLLSLGLRNKSTIVTYMGIFRPLAPGLLARGIICKVTNDESPT